MLLGSIYRHDLAPPPSIGSRAMRDRLVVRARIGPPVPRHGIHISKPDDASVFREVR